MLGWSFVSTADNNYYYSHNVILKDLLILLTRRMTHLDIDRCLCVTYSNTLANKSGRACVIHIHIGEKSPKMRVVFVSKLDICTWNTL